MNIDKRKQFIFNQRQFLYNFKDKEFSSIESAILQYLSNLKKHKAPKKDLELNTSPNSILRIEKKDQQDSESHPFISTHLFNNGYILGWLSFDNLLIQPKNGLLNSIDEMMSLFTSYFEHFSVYRPTDFIELSVEELKPTLIRFPKN